MKKMGGKADFKRTGGPGNGEGDVSGSAPFSKKKETKRGEAKTVFSSRGKVFPLKS